MRKIREIASCFLTPVTWISSLFLAVSAVIYAYNCMLRYGFRAALPWPEEFCTYIVVLMVFLMQCRLEFSGEELSISVLEAKVKNRPVLRRLLFTFQGTVTIAVYGMLIKVGISVVRQNYAYGAVSAVMLFPMGLYFFLINVCLVLVIVYWAVNLFTKSFDHEEQGGSVND